jgi:hypothetical protein
MVRAQPIHHVLMRNIRYMLALPMQARDSSLTAALTDAAAGIYTQFDVLKQGGLPGHGSGAYGHDYALQIMLMQVRKQLSPHFYTQNDPFTKTGSGQTQGKLQKEMRFLSQDELGMARRALTFLANITLDAGQRYSKYNFFEQFAVPRTPNQSQVGCGELNLVNAMAPIKVARLILGVDDTNPAATVLRPRLPPGWSEATATHWPVLILTLGGMRTVRVNISVTADEDGGASDVQLSVEGGQSLPRLSVRLGSSQAGFHWRNYTNVTHLTFGSTEPCLNTSITY